jgi:hypothetical protein
MVKVILSAKQAEHLGLEEGTYARVHLPRRLDIPAETHTHDGMTVTVEDSKLYFLQFLRGTWRYVLCFAEGETEIEIENAQIDIPDLGLDRISKKQIQRRLRYLGNSYRMCPDTPRSRSVRTLGGGRGDGNSKS